MKSTFILATSVVAMAPATSLMAKSKVKALRPNIIVILADDLGYGDISANGSKTISTPNIDALAHGGVRFTRGYATSATSTPSRYALMTGMYPWKNADAKILPGDAPLIISGEQPTMPKMFRSAGYATGAVGKWHLGMGRGHIDWNEQISPCVNDVGFDYSCMMAATQDRVPTVYIENGRVAGLDKNDPLYVDYHKNFEGEPTALTNPEMLKLGWSQGHNNSVHNGIPRIGFQKGGVSARWKDEEMAFYFLDKVKTFIDKNKSNPFFLYYGLNEPHVPRTPNGMFVGKSGMGARGDAILEADWCVGELIKKLTEDGLLDNTIIVFTSDNGPVLDDGYKDQAEELVGNHKPAWIYRGGKYSLFEGGTRIPLIVYWKGHIQPKTSEAMVCQMDFFASFADLLGQKIEKGLDSRDYLSAFMGKSDKARKDLVIEAAGRLAYRCDNWVMIPPYKGPARNETKNELGNLKEYTLYDLSKDAPQQINVADKYPRKLEEMKNRLKAIRAASDQTHN
jgi:arylsulfatase A-like enzyme